MKILESPIKYGRLLLVIPIAGVCISGCAMLPLAAVGTGAAGAGMQALGTAAGAVGMQTLGEKVGDAMDYMRGGEPMADVTYWTRPAPLKNIVEQTLQDIASSSLVALEYSRSYQEDEDLFVLSTSTGSELRVLIRDEPTFDDLHATQMIVDLETAGAASTETAQFVEAVQEIDSRTERRGIEKIRGDFNYLDGLSAYDSEAIQPQHA
ncbi:MAG: hypothetical protein ACREVE_05840 [Gammaproteobacteria bacterium]